MTRRSGVIENTLAAAEAAVAAGFAIECDVQLSRDERGLRLPRRHARPSDGRDRGADPRARRRSGATCRRGEKRGAGRAASIHSIPPFSDFWPCVAGRVPIVCELKSRFDGDWRIGDRVAALASAYEGPLALKSFDPDLVAYLRLKHPRLGPPGRPCPIGIVAEASYDDPYWAFLAPEQKRACETSTTAPAASPTSSPGTSTTCRTRPLSSRRSFMACRS